MWNDGSTVARLYCVLRVLLNNVWSLKIWTTHNLSLWLYEYFWIILLYGHLVYFILKVLAWEICNMKWGFAKKVIIKSQRQFMYGSNFYGSDVRYIVLFHTISNYNCVVCAGLNEHCSKAEFAEEGSFFANRFPSQRTKPT